MLTGQLPWEAETVTQMIQAHRYTEPEPLPPVPGLPADVVDLCARSLAKLPGDRPSADEVARRLAAAVGVRVPLPLDDALAWNPMVPTDGETERIVNGVPVGDSARRSLRRRRPRVAVLATGAAMAVTATGLATWSAFSPEPTANAAALAGAPKPQVAESPARCEVRYQTKKDEGKAFAVDVTVVNSGDRPAQGWTLRFDFPADQQLTGGTGATWSQSGRTVTAQATGLLAPGDTATVSLTGGYQASNPIPTEFTLGDDTCRGLITGAAAVPASLPGTTAAGRAPAATAPKTAPQTAAGTAPAAATTATGIDQQRLQQLREQLRKAQLDSGNKSGKGAKSDNGGKGGKGGKSDD
jgi:serine/threonine-protein kinase